MKTLVYHAGALGDFVTILPALAVFRREHPDAEMILLGRRSFGDLAMPAGIIDQVLDVESSIFASLFYGRPSEAAARALAGCDTALLFAADASLLPASLAMLGVSTVHRQHPFPPDRTHVVDYHLDFFPHGPLSREDRIPFLFKVAPRGISPTPVVTIHPGSGAPIKNWCLTNFIDLAGLLRKRGARIVWVRGEVEDGMNLPQGDVVVDEPPLNVLCQLLQATDVYVGNDSGVSHLAAACNVPSVVLFGPSDPLVWAPRGDRVVIVDAPGACTRCHRGKSPEGPCALPCMGTIQVDAVLDHVRTLLRMS